MPISPQEWIDSVDIVDTVEVGGETEVILYIEEDDPLRIRHRMSLSDFVRIFRPVFLEAESPDDISAEDFRAVIGQNPEADTELLRKDIGYEDVIDYWVDNEIFENNSSSSSSF